MNRRRLLFSTTALALPALASFAPGNSSPATPAPNLLGTAGEFAHGIAGGWTPDNSATG